MISCAAGGTAGAAGFTSVSGLRHHRRQGHHLPELPLELRPIGQDLLAPARSRWLPGACKSSALTSARLPRCKPLQPDQLRVDTSPRTYLQIEHVGHAARHARAEILARPPSTTTVPLVMYSQPWSPSPSTTAVAPELRTAKRSPARPLAKSSRRSRRTDTCCPRSSLVRARTCAPDAA